MLWLAQATSVEPASPAASPQPATATAERDCSSPTSTANSRDIVICAERPQGYRLNPDVMEARREVRSGGRPTRPGSTQVDRCAVGPRDCQSAGINLVAAAITAATMVERAVTGTNVGEMFVTDPHPSEYQLYVMAKKRREAREAEAAATARAKASMAPGSPPGN